MEIHDQGQGPGFASNTVLRGFTGDHSSDLLLVVDGVPVNLPVHGHVEGYADWNFLFPGAVSSLRVIHGPSSPLYGDFSVAGTMEVFTKPDAEGTAAQFSANEFGDLSVWATTGRRGERGGALAGLDLRRTEGWRGNSGRNIGNVLLRGWRPVGGGRLEGGIALHGAEWESPGFLSITDFEDRNLKLAADPSDGGDQKRGVLHGRYAAPIGAGRFIQVMGWGVISDWELFLTVPGHTDPLGNLYQTSESDSRWGAGTRIEFNWIPRSGELTIGAEARKDRSEYDQIRTLRQVGIEDLVAVDAGHTSVSGYARWRWHLSDRLGVDLGARVDHLRNRSMNRLGLEPSNASSRRHADLWPPISYHIIGEGGPVGEWIDGSQTLFSPKLGAELRLSDRWALMASSSRGFRSAVGILGDPERLPVTVWAQELGVEYDAPTFGAHLSVFRSDVSNERIQDPITLVISSAGSSVRQGVEAMVDLDLSRGVTLSGRGTYTDAVLSGSYADAHDDHNQGSSGSPDISSPKQDVPGIARYMGQLSVEGPIRERLEARLEWRVMGPYVPIGEPDVETDPYSTVDARVSYAVRSGLIVDLEVRNLLDRVYPELRSSGYVSPGTPRSLSLTMHLLEGRQ